MVSYGPISDEKVCALFGTSVTFWVLARKEPLRNAKFQFFLRAKHVFSRKSPLRSGSWRLPKKMGHCAALLLSQVPKKCTDLDLSLLYILASGTYSNFARKNNFLALGVCFPQPCSSATRRFTVSRSRLKNHRRIVSFAQQKNR